MYLAIDIQMLILVVKLYVFSDYILRKRVPKSQISTNFCQYWYQNIGHCFLNFTGLKQRIIILFGALGKLWKLRGLCGKTLFMLQPTTYWIVLHIGIKVRWGTWEAGISERIFISQINISTLSFDFGIALWQSLDWM